MTPPGRVALQGVWKKYRLGERHDSLRDLLPALARSILRRDRPSQLDSHEFWALRDVSFEVQPGEVLGIIGPNGAGKSTILKLLSKILLPTRGRIEVGGHVGALIELAAGFHPDLTGRENVHLQGAIMGMKRAEIAREFDEIVAFAGIEEFIDTPVKRYSSGMNARLGFAIAAHLDPDVLLVDEVLSVGDYEFQRRALERVRAIVQRNIPVVIVSHQLDRVMELCDRAILLASGTIVKSGTAAECVAAYVDGEQLHRQEGLAPPPVRLEELSDPVPAHVVSGEPVTVRVRGHIVDAETARHVGVGVRLQVLPSEERLFATHHVACGVTLPEEGPFELEVRLRMTVGPGIYRVQAAAWDLRSNTEWARGPSALLEVESVSTSYGRLNLSPDMRLIES